MSTYSHIHLFTLFFSGVETEELHAAAAGSWGQLTGGDDDSDHTS